MPFYIKNEELLIWQLPILFTNCYCDFVLYDTKICPSHPAYKEARPKKMVQGLKWYSCVRTSPPHHCLPHACTLKGLRTPGRGSHSNLRHFTSEAIATTSFECLLVGPSGFGGSWNPCNSLHHCLCLCLTPGGPGWPIVRFMELLQYPLFTSVLFSL